MTTLEKCSSQKGTLSRRKNRNSNILIVPANLSPMHSHPSTTIICKIDVKLHDKG